MFDRLACLCRSMMLVACGLMAVGRADGQPADVLRVALAADIRGTQPGMSTDDVTSIVNQHIFEGLVAYRADGSAAPLLAERFEVSADGRTYVFTLRSGVTFHNGKPLTPAVVVAAWRRFLDPATAWPCAVYFDGRQDLKIESVTAMDDRSVAFSLDQPNALFLSMMARSDCDGTGIAHPDSVNADGSWREPIGTGPFKFVEWRPGESVRLAKFDAYSPSPGPRDGYAGDKMPLVSELLWPIIPDPATTKTALQAGQIDIWYGADHNMKQELASDPAIRLQVSPEVGLAAIVMQTRDPVLRDARVRRAINMALDFDQLVGALYHGEVGPNNSLIPETSPYFGPVERQGWKHGIAGARKLLDEAGYRGQPITLTTNRRFPIMYDVAIIVQSMVQQAGINLQLEVIDWPTQLDKYNAGRYQMITFFYSPQLDPAIMVDRFTGDKDQQANKVWDNAEARALVKRFQQVAEPAGRQALFDRIQELFMADPPMIVLNSGAILSATSRRVEGYEAWPGRKPRLWGVRLRQE